MASTSVPSCLFATLPVVHSAHFDSDLSTEVLAAPPSIEAVRQLAKKNEPKKLIPPASYLPLSDPGTTYTGLAGGLAALALEESGHRQKRARLDKGPSNRAQRASARNALGASVNGSEPVLGDGHDHLVQVTSDNGSNSLDGEPSTHSRSTSARLSADIQSTEEVSSRRRNRAVPAGTGKESEKGKAAVRVKEEPAIVQLSEIPISVMNQRNEDHCSSCSSIGALVYCDGCPRAFHFWCLNPPMDPSEFPEGEESWYCPGCKIKETPAPRVSHSILSPLLRHLQSVIPVEFQLPEDIRTYFKDVSTGPDGAYIDNSAVKTFRIGRHGLGEERDPYRLKDNRGASVICFRCGKSALPQEVMVESPSKRARRHSSLNSENWRRIISCDFCSLHWHVDCLDPPMVSLPPLLRKWKCPNHAASSTAKQRTPKSTGPSIDISDVLQPNNGNIEVVNSEWTSRSQDRVSVDEILINGRKYRVPERVIILDFWNKVGQQSAVRRPDRVIQPSVTSSPLTSLSSLEDRIEYPPPLVLSEDSEDDLKVAEILCRLQSGSRSLPSRNKKQVGVQTEDTNSGNIQLRGVSDFIRQVSRNTSPKQVKLHDNHCHRSTNGVTSIKIHSKKTYANGIRLSRSDNLTAISSHATNNGFKHKESASSPISKSHPGLDNSRDYTLTGPDRSEKKVKPSISPLKIRIPSRPKQIQAATTNLSNSTSLPAPRRSLRRHSSTTGTSSDRSQSVDQLHDNLP